MTTAGADELLVSARGLTRRFGDFVAVRGIDVDVPRGRVLGFLGPNGSGKSTTIRMLAGLLAPSAGRITGFGGVDLARDPDAWKRRLGYMSQKFSLYSDLTVQENISLYGGIYGLSDSGIREGSDALLDSLNLRPNANSRVSSLPLGWKQKLAFSVAMLHKPKIVFLDEPTGGVDPITRRTFWEMIYAAATTTTIFVTTHYMDEAEYCDRISIMVDGRIATLGTPSELKAEWNVPTIDELFVRLARPT